MKTPSITGAAKTALFMVLLAGATHWNTSAQTHSDSTDPLRVAVDNPQRTPAFVARDTARHPYETLRFFEIEPHMTVLEITPGGGWYTEILAPYLFEQGRYIAATYDGRSSVERYQRYAKVFEDKLASNPAVFNRVEVLAFEPPDNLKLTAPNSVDRVLTFRNVHNWLAYSETTALGVFRSMFESLKPGGYLGLVEHRLPAQRPWDAAAMQTGYVHEDTVIRLAQRAGFVLVAKSEVNANPKDTADHVGGVWALPPSYRNQNVDRARFEAIGESDRMTLKFVKPPQ